MARTSRTTAPVIEIKELFRIYKVGLYVRLSVLDSGKKDSDTIENQEAILRAFIENKPQFALQEVYIDNGETGVNFERDEFERLIDDVKSGKIDCIIVKDLSRFGRNYIEAGEYLEKIFPFLGVRFIATNDNYDSVDPSTSDSLSMHLKNLVNDIYARDISRKICPVLRAKQERGEFIGAWAAYGYKKDENDKHKLVVDDEVAHIVRDIFHWRLSGLSYQSIARKLNECGGPSPSRYRYEKGIIKDKRLANTIWRIAAVKTILENEVYAGHMVQGRKREALWDRQKQIKVPKEQWIVARNTHEAIIDETTYRKVQQINEQTTKEYHAKLERFSEIENTENILKSLVYCGDCGTLLMRYKNVRENKHKEPKFHVWYNYICPVHAAEPSRCSFLRIPEKDLQAAVFGVIQTQITIALDMDKLIRNARNHAPLATEKQKLQAKIRQTMDEINRISRLRETLYDDYRDKLMNERDYLYSQKRYKEKETVLRARLDEVKLQESALRETKSEENPWLQAVLSFCDEPVLTRKMAEALIDKVVIHSNTAITVKLRFEDEYKKLQEGLSPVLEVAANA